jgi:predicted nucleic acid-binding protein
MAAGGPGLSARPVVLDTDVASQLHKDRLPEPLAATLAGSALCATFVTIAELAHWVHVRRWGAHSRASLDRWLHGVEVLPYDVEVARTWGRLSAAARRRGRPRSANDTWIAACCLVADLPLVTLNWRDFADFAEHHGLRLVT